jgi:hypothetical protein
MTNSRLKLEVQHILLQIISNFSVPNDNFAAFMFTVTEKEGKKEIRLEDR